MKQACCSVINSDYVSYFKTFMYSLLQHNSDFDMDYIVLCDKDDLTKGDIKSLNSLYNNFIFRQINLNAYDSMNMSNTKGLRNKTAGSHHFKNGIWSYYRLDLFLLEEYFKVNWFDVDMLVTGSLGDFFALRDDDHVLACVDQIGTARTKKKYASENHYINAGVVSYGKNLLTEENYFALIDKASSEFETLTLADQTLIIKTFRDKIKFINTKFNTHHKITISPCRQYPKADLNNVAIIHYCGSQKPWNYINRRSRATSTHQLWLNVYDKMMGGTSL